MDKQLQKKLALWGSVASIIGLTIAAIGFLTGKQSVGDILGISNTGTKRSEVFSQISNISYQYYGTLGVVGIASGAKAYNGKRIVAEAKLIYDGEFAPGSLKSITVNEKHFDVNGDVIYVGEIIFEMNMRYTVMEENAITGIRPLQVFDSWPSRS